MTLKSVICKKSQNLKIKVSIPGVKTVQIDFKMNSKSGLQDWSQGI